MFQHLGDDFTPRAGVIAALAFDEAIAILVSQAAFAANPTCEVQATEKKLSGAAKNSFGKKCEKDAKAKATKTCDAQTAEKKLAGAAKTSFTKKCVADATVAAK